MVGAQAEACSKSCLPSPVCSTALIHNLTSVWEEEKQDRRSGKQQQEGVPTTRIPQRKADKEFCFISGTFMLEHLTEDEAEGLISRHRGSKTSALLLFSTEYGEGGPEHAVSCFSTQKVQVFTDDPELIALPFPGLD